MSALTYLALALGAVSLVIFMIKCHKQRSVEGVFIKNIVSLFFLMTSKLVKLKQPVLSFPRDQVVPRQTLR